MLAPIGRFISAAYHFTIAGGCVDHFAAVVDDNADVAHLAEIIAVEANEVTLLQIIHISNLSQSETWE